MRPGSAPGKLELSKLPALEGVFMSSPQSILLQVDSSSRTTERIRLARQLADEFNAEVIAQPCMLSSIARHPMALEGSSSAIALMQEFDEACLQKAHATFMKAAGSSRSAGIAVMSGPDRRPPPWPQAYVHLRCSASLIAKSAGRPCRKKGSPADSTTGDWGSCSERGVPRQ